MPKGKTDMIIDPDTTWGDIQEILDNSDAPLTGPTDFFGLTRKDIMSMPSDGLVYDDTEEDDNVSTDIS